MSFITKITYMKYAKILLVIITITALAGASMAVLASKHACRACGVYVRANPNTTICTSWFTANYTSNPNTLTPTFATYESGKTCTRIIPLYACS